MVLALDRRKIMLNGKAASDPTHIQRRRSGIQCYQNHFFNCRLRISYQHFYLCYMILRAQLLKEHSRANCDKVVRWIGADQQRFDELITLFVGDQYRVVQRAAWPLGYAAMAHPHLVKKHFVKQIFLKVF